jgi:hypothetical protein
MDTHYAVQAEIQFRHPETKEVLSSVVFSKQFPADKRARYDTSVNVGDYVTAVSLPGKFGATLALYGFLGLNPQRNFLQFAGKVPGVLMAALQVLALCGIFAVLFGNVYALSMFEPLEFDYVSVLPLGLIASAALVGPSLVIAYGMHRREMKELAERNRQALAQGKALEVSSSLWGRNDAGSVILKLIILAGFLVMGTVTMICLLFAVNALSDSSQGELKPVKIERLEQETHKFVLRTYKIRFRSPTTGKEVDFSTTPENIEQFLTPENFVKPLGIIEIHDGYFGWPWIKSMKPLE